MYYLAFTLKYPKQIKREIGNKKANVMLIGVG